MYELTYEDSERHSRRVFQPLLNQYRRAKRIYFFLGILFVWIITLIALFFLFAYRPTSRLAFLSIVWTTQNSRSQMSNGAAAMSFREYLGRTIGAIPPACAITDTELSVPVGEDRPGQPFLVKLLDPGFGNESVSSGEELFYTPCLWRNHWGSMIAAVSLDVGPVQKITLLLLIIALAILWRDRLFRKIEREAWPINDKHRSDAKKDEMVNENEINKGEPKDELARATRDDRVAQHPISILISLNTGAQSEPLYPTRTLILDPLLAEGESRTRDYKNTVEKIRDKLSGNTLDDGLIGPMDLILDVLKSGAHTGRVGEAEKRMRIAVFEYGRSLSDRLETAHYLMWLMPVVGFLGTIYGISTSLVRAKGLFKGTGTLEANDFATSIQGVVDGLGVAFDTTSMALLCSAVLYWYIIRSEASISKVVDRARKSLSNLLVDRMVDRPLMPDSKDSDLT